MEKQKPLHTAFRLEPWLNERLLNYARDRGINKTDALHEYIRELETEAAKMAEEIASMKAVVHTTAEAVKSVPKPTAKYWRCPLSSTLMLDDWCKSKQDSKTCQNVSCEHYGKETQ